jgi:glutathione synthase/RimK-type ligase-like ATP-grasp enzyme
MAMGLSSSERKIAVYYEHPEWFRQFFAELDRRRVQYDRLHAEAHRFDPTERETPYSLIVNRMSPSAFTRGHAQAILYTLQYLAHLKEIKANVINGYDAYLNEFSKARQIGLLHRLGLRFPRAKVINAPSESLDACGDLEFPIVIKPNIGGSGAKIVKFNSQNELKEAVDHDQIDLGIDNTALVQEYLPAQGNSIVRVEILGGEYLYAIRLFLTGGEFNLCPADYCKVPVQPRQGSGDGVSGRRTVVEAYTPPLEVIENVKRIASAAQIEVGGVEYLVNDQDGQVYYYDINALSNFVADAPRVLGFDPTPRFVDYILSRAGSLQILTA